MRKLGSLVIQYTKSDTAGVGAKVRWIWAWALGHHATSCPGFLGVKVGGKNCHWPSGNLTGHSRSLLGLSEKWLSRNSVPLQGKGAPCLCSSHPISLLCLHSHPWPARCWLLLPSPRGQPGMERSRGGDRARLRSQAASLLGSLGLKFFSSAPPSLSELTTSCYPSPQSPQKPQYSLARVVVAGVYWAPTTCPAPYQGLAMYHFSKPFLPPSELAATLPLVLVRKLR